MNQQDVEMIKSIVKNEIKSALQDSSDTIAKSIIKQIDVAKTQPPLCGDCGNTCGETCFGECNTTCFDECTSEPYWIKEEQVRREKRSHINEEIITKFCDMNGIETSREELYDLSEFPDVPIPINQCFCMKKRLKYDFLDVPREGDIPENLTYLMILFAIKKFRIRKDKYRRDLMELSEHHQYHFDADKCFDVIHKYEKWNVHEINFLADMYNDDETEQEKEKLAKSVAKDIKLNNFYEKYQVVMGITGIIMMIIIVGFYLGQILIHYLKL